MRRRSFVRTAAGLLVLPAVSHAAPTQVEDRKLQNRLELWRNFAMRTSNLLARITTTRETSLLEAPLVVTGTLAFVAPSRLILRDDGLTGSATRIDGHEVHITLNRSASTPPRAAARTTPAATWMADRLLRMFAPGDEQDLVAGARTHIPRGRGYRLELMPPRTSLVRKAVRSLTLTLDPVAGAITELTIAEAQGDRVRLQLTDHRQNLPSEDVESVFE